MFPAKRLPERGKKKAHKHKVFWPVTVRWGGVSRSGVQGSKIYVLSSETKEHKSFCPGARAGRPVMGVTGKSLSYVLKLYVPFLLPIGDQSGYGAAVAVTLHLLNCCRRPCLFHT